MSCAAPVWLMIVHFNLEIFFLILQQLKNQINLPFIKDDYLAGFYC